MDKSLSAGLLAQQRLIARSGMKYIIVYILLLAAAYIYLDIEMPDSDGAFILMSFAGIGLNFFLLYNLVQCSDVRDDGPKSGFGAFFGLSFLHSIVVTIGLICFILPGLFSALRWMPAFARLLNSDEGVMEAFRWSWQRTSGKEASLAVAFLPVVVIHLVGVVALFGTSYLYEIGIDVSPDTLESLVIPMVVLSNIALSVGSAWYTLLGVASYVCLREDERGVAEAFD